MEPKDRIIVALDVGNSSEAMRLVKLLQNHVGMFKVGLQLFLVGGIRFVQHLVHGRKVRVFLDLKFYDIPNTVAGASREAAKLGVHMFNMHCLGGVSMMQTGLKGAVEGTQETKIARLPIVLGVTILTSHDYNSLLRHGLVKSPSEVSGTDCLIDRPYLHCNWMEEHCSFRCIQP